MTELKEFEEFLSNHIKTFDDKHYPFKLKSHQRNTALRLLKEDGSFIISKSRQVGMTLLVLLISIWKILKNEKGNYHSLILVSNRGQQKYVIERLHNLVSEINSNLTSGSTVMSIAKSTSVVQIGTNSIEVMNGQTLKNKSISQDYYDFIAIDEFAYFYDDDMEAERILKNVKRGLKPTSISCIHSTPKKKNDVFSKLFLRALRGQNLSIPIQLDWAVDLDNDIQWRRDRNKLVGLEYASIEYDGLMTLNDHLPE